MTAEMYASEPFDVCEPDALRLPIVLNSPHSGRDYPAAFLNASRLDSLSIRRSEDHYVDELFAPAVALGAPLLRAHFPRAYLDVNREPYELDPRMFDSPLPPYANVSSMRVAGGLGTIPRLVAENMDIYRSRLPLAEAFERIETIYKPYHACLRRLIARSHVTFGFAVLLDCHSMPGNVRLPHHTLRPDIIVGDRYGTSASADLSHIAVALLEELGFSVARNKPYAGGFITEHYGRPARGLHALQLEINRSLYIDELTLEKKPQFARLAADMLTFVAQLAEHVEIFADQSRLAAE